MKWPDGRGRQGQRGRGLLRAAHRRRDRLRRVRLRQAEQAGRTARMKNSDGEFVAPDDETFKAAAAGADWKKAPGHVRGADRPAGQGQLADHRRLVHPDAQEAGRSPRTRKEVLKFFDWSFKNGDKMADELDYVPMPDPVVKLIQADVEVAAQGRVRQGRSTERASSRRDCAARALVAATFQCRQASPESPSPSASAILRRIRDDATPHAARAAQSARWMDAVFRAAHAVLRVPRLQPARGDPGLAADRQPAVAREVRLARSSGPSEWDPVQEKFGALVPIYGTLVTSAHRHADRRSR